MPDGKVWAVQGFAFGDMWWTSDGTSTGGLIDPPDTDAWDASDLGGSRAWYAGGSDGTYIYQLAIDSTGQWWVDKFDGALTSLLDRWEVTGWTSAFGGDQWEGFFDVQHVCADGSRVVVVTDKLNSTSDQVSIEVSVFDLTGTLLDQWSDATDDTINTNTGSCTDGEFVYFWIDVGGSGFNATVFKVDLSTGARTALFTIDDIAAQSPDPDNIYIDPGGIVVVEGGDLIVAGNNCVARVQQDGTLVWITQSPNAGPPQLQSLAHSGLGSVWAGQYTNARAEEYQYDGTYVQTIDIPESTLQAWLVQLVVTTRWWVGAVGWT